MSNSHSLVMEKRSPSRPLTQSTMVRSPIPKSPVPKSPMPKSPAYEKYKSRCAYSLVSFFHFRQNHSKKMISNRKHVRRYVRGDQYTGNRLDNVDEKCQSINDGIEQMTTKFGSANVEVQKIMEEGIPLEQKRTEVSIAKVRQVRSDAEFAGQPSRNHRKAKKTSRRRFPIYGCYDISTMGHQKPAHQDQVDESLKKSESILKTKELSSQVLPQNGRHCNVSSTDIVRCDRLQLNEINLQVRLNDAAETFINQKLIDGRHGGDGLSHQSKHFLEALEILNSNRDLFVKLLQDPNSLLVKHIEDLRDSQTKMPLTRPLAEDQINHESGLEKFKCNNRYVSRGSGLPQQLEDIVILKPGLTSLQSSSDRISHDNMQVVRSLRSVQQSIKPTIFQFEEMKRKLMRAIGIRRKDQRLVLTDGLVDRHVTTLPGFKNCETRSGVETFEANSTKKTSDFEGTTVSYMDAKRKEHLEKFKNSDSGAVAEGASSTDSSCEQLNLSPVGNSKQNKYGENRIQNSGVSNNGIVNFLRKQRPKTWDGTSSVPDYDFLPTVSPRRKKELGSVTPHMRFSSYSNYKMLNDNFNYQREDRRCLSPTKQNLEDCLWAYNEKHDQLQMLETMNNLSDGLFRDTKMHKIINSSATILSPEEINESESEETIPSCLTSKLDGSCNNGVSQNIVAANTCKHSPMESHTLPSSSPLSIQRAEDFERTRNLEEQPSPVSVLELFSSDDNMSPSSTESRNDESSVPPLQIGIEDGRLATLPDCPLDRKSYSRTSTDKHRSVSEYVHAVIQISGLKFEELSLKCHLSDQLLDHALSGEVAVHTDQSCGDHRLLFGYINEVLIEICHCYIKCSPWVSFIIPKVQPHRLAENLVHEVMNHVNWKLLLEEPLQTLDQIVENDMTESRTWMDTRIDAEDTVSEIVESILGELVMETALE